MSMRAVKARAVRRGASWTAPAGLRQLTGAGAKAPLVLMLLSGCALRGGEGRMMPRLDALSPDRATVGNGAIVQVTVTGAGFDSLNTLHFGALVIPGVPRTGAGTLRFTVPLDDTFLPNRGGAPLQPIAPGTYPVIVETARGRSNALVFTLLPGSRQESQ